MCLDVGRWHHRLESPATTPLPVEFQGLKVMGMEEFINSSADLYFYFIFFLSSLNFQVRIILKEEM